MNNFFYSNFGVVNAIIIYKNLSLTVNRYSLA